VAQDSMIAICQHAGILEESILSLDHDSPGNQKETCFVATDDLVLVHRSRQTGAATLQRLDASFEDHHVLRNTKKDVSLASSVTALGCDLSNNPVKVEPNGTKLTTRNASPRALHACLGVWEWFAIMQRPLFSIYDSIYGFVRSQPAGQVRDVPSKVQDEMLLTLLLAPLLPIRLDRAPLPLLVATDASKDFGFGVSVSKCNVSEAAEVCRLAERRGDYVRLTADPDDPGELPRLGKPHRLPLSKHDFRTVISAKSQWKAHSGVLEAHGYLLGLK
ncbi:unnamed protein product, partial [Symbiodinium sp. CCMP2592]